MAPRVMDRSAEPLLKWAGGKRQLLPQLRQHVPLQFNRYIEPMIGGGALFFALSPNRAVISDSNPELVNFYRTVVSDMDGIVRRYEAWTFAEETFYELRGLSFYDLDPVEAAARTLYLNRSFYNGLYRVNRKGEFNVPWGRYKRPHKIDQRKWQKAREVLSRAEIHLGDYKDVVRAVSQAGDFIFLDPPYVPIGPYSDFKRYTRTQFCEADHAEMAALARELADKDCHVLITNSNHPLVHDLYRGYRIEVVPTKRNVNSKGSGRAGEDVIINAKAA
jgi:DNA adenine methylase